MFISQEKKIQFSQKVGKLKDKGREWLDNWSDRSNEFIGNFLDMFGGRDSRLVLYLTSFCFLLCYFNPFPNTPFGDCPKLKEAAGNN